MIGLIDQKLRSAEGKFVVIAVIIQGMKVKASCVDIQNSILVYWFDRILRQLRCPPDHAVAGLHVYMPIPTRQKGRTNNVIVVMMISTLTNHPTDMYHL